MLGLFRAERALQASGTLTEASLDGAGVTLDLIGDQFASAVTSSQVTVAGLTGVSIASVTRNSNTRLTLTLAHTGATVDAAQLTFTVAAAAIDDYALPLAATLVVDRTYTVASPDGTLTATVRSDGGDLFYAVSRDGNELVAESPLSIRNDLDHVVTGSQTSSHDSTWEPTWGLYSSIRDHHNRLTLNLEVGDIEFDLIFQVYNDGLGFRFAADQQAALTGTSADFNVRYNMFAGYMAHWPVGEHSPEGPHDVGSLPDDPTFLLLVNAGSKGFFALMESDLFSAEAFTTIKFERISGQPAIRSNIPSRPIPAEDFITPWRVVLVGDEPGDLLESTVTVNVAAPLELDDASWIEPGKAFFNWRTLGYETDDGNFTYRVNTETVKRLVDYAAELGIDYVQIDDEWWTRIDDGGQTVNERNNFDLDEIMAHAASKGVNMTIYIDKQPPRPITIHNTTDEQLYQLFADKGASAIKYGFHGNVPLFTRTALRSLAEKEIVVNFHDGPVPFTGARRTMPNAITRQTGWGQQDSRTAYSPTDYLEMAFINALLGPFDQINGIYDINRMPDRSKGSDNAINTTIASENARVFTTFSGLIMLPDVPEEYIRKAEMFEFIQEMPTTWDDTRILHGSIPNYITTARRSGEGVVRLLGDQ